MRIALVTAALSALLAAATAGAATGSAAGATYVPRMESVALCQWDRPGHNPFMGEVVPAIDRYVDIPTPVRMRLKQRMAVRQYDDLVEIRRDSIRGKHDYRPEIRDMHFGLDQVCRQVTRSAWTDATRERGLVYCDSGHCILVPTVCRNVSRIARQPEQLAGAPAGSDASSQALAFDPPGAGADVATPTATSSFAEGVAGAGVPLWPTGLGSGTNDTGAPPDGLPPQNTPPPWHDGEPGLPGSTGGPGDDGLPPGGQPGGEDNPGGGGFGGGGGSGGGGGGGGLPGNVPVTPVPEPATWASLLAGLALLVALRAARQRRTGAPKCATQ